MDVTQFDLPLSMYSLAHSCNIVSIFGSYGNYATQDAPPRQKGLTDNFLKLSYYLYHDQNADTYPLKLNPQNITPDFFLIFFVYQSMEAQHSNWKLSQNIQYVSPPPHDAAVASARESGGWAGVPIPCKFGSQLCYYI